MRSIVSMGRMGPSRSPRSGARAWCESRLRSEEHTSELQSPDHLVCRLLLEKKNRNERKDCFGAFWAFEKACVRRLRVSSDGRLQGPKEHRRLCCSRLFPVRRLSADVYNSEQ